MHAILLPLVRCGGATREIKKLDKLTRGLWTLEDVTGRSVERENKRKVTF